MAKHIPDLHFSKEGKTCFRNRQFALSGKSAFDRNGYQKPQTELGIFRHTGFTNYLSSKDLKMIYRQVEGYDDFHFACRCRSTKPQVDE
jgi:hypothetical protein